MDAECDSFHPLENYTSWVGVVGDVLWEPLWQLSTRLRPVEIALLSSSPLRRLHFIHHAGASYISSYHTHSRLQHTLGVFSLISYFFPEDDLIRVAALLHDIGHAPFSHTLDQLDGFDHHQQTTNYVLSSPVADILLQHGIDPRVILSYIRGKPANLLRNTENILHIDHLDSWVRSAQVQGILPLSAKDLLRQLSLREAYLDTNTEIAEILVDIIVAEARFHCSTTNLGTSTILRHLVKQVIESQVTNINALTTMTDSTLERILFETPLTAKEARRLWYHSDAIIVNRLNSNVPTDAYVVQVDNLYLATPLTGGIPITQVSPKAAAFMSEIRRLLGKYEVYWRKDANSR